MGATGRHHPQTHHPRPAGRLRWVFALPSNLYRRELGWLLARRLLALTYRGRRTGRTLTTVLEVIHHDRATRESVVVSGYGPTAGWYLSIKASPALRIQSGRLDYAPQQRFLSSEEARSVAEVFVRAHQVEAQLVRPVLVRIGAIEADRPDSATDLLASLPMVAFRPAEGQASASDAPRAGDTGGQRGHDRDEAVEGFPAADTRAASKARESAHRPGYR
jgi:deazaflavin-dependent oxidoreductase (nitroreductase family)